MSGIHSGLSMLIIADILLLCARILHKSKSFISEAIYFLILIFISISSIILNNIFSNMPEHHIHKYYYFRYCNFVLPP